MKFEVKEPVVVKPPKEFVLTLTEEEAKLLYYLCANIGGYWPHDGGDETPLSICHTGLKNARVTGADIRNKVTDRLYQYLSTEVF